jgi:trans-aconitate 2-methyltransferase
LRWSRGLDYEIPESMSTWDTAQYLKFGNERTQPAIDLAARISLESPNSIVDLGCGPGNSTAVVARRWPRAKLVGVDNSATMLARARDEFPQIAWVNTDIFAWAETNAGHATFDLVFSNAALQWVGDHRRLLPRLFDCVAPGGALAFQVPGDPNATAHRVVRELAGSAGWRSHFTPAPREWHVHPPEFYYDLLAPKAARVDLWCTDYLHVLASVDGVVEWYRGTGLRPWLDVLPDDATRTQFLGAYRARLVAYFPERADGKVLFPFRRLFVIAYR